MKIAKLHLNIRENAQKCTKIHQNAAKSRRIRQNARVRGPQPQHWAGPAPQNPLQGSQIQHFAGPAAIALAYRYNLDSRDAGEAERFDVVNSGEGGIWACSYANECSEVCPKHVDPAQAIQRMKLTSAVQWLGVWPKRGAE